MTAKIDDSKDETIRVMHRTGFSVKEISEDTGVSQATVRRVILGRDTALKAEKNQRVRVKLEQLEALKKAKVLARNVLDLRELSTREKPLPAPLQTLVNEAESWLIEYAN